MIKKGENYYEKMDSVLSVVLAGTKSLKIDWYSGLLLTACGSNSNPDQYDFFYINGYEKYSLFEIEAGNYRQHRDFDN